MEIIFYNLYISAFGHTIHYSINCKITTLCWQVCMQRRHWKLHAKN